MTSGLIDGVPGFPNEFDRDVESERLSVGSEVSHAQGVVGGSFELGNSALGTTEFVGDVLLGKSLRSPKAKERLDEPTA